MAMVPPHSVSVPNSVKRYFIGVGKACQAKHSRFARLIDAILEDIDFTGVFLKYAVIYTDEENKIWNGIVNSRDVYQYVFLIREILAYFDAVKPSDKVTTDLFWDKAKEIYADEKAIAEFRQVDMGKVLRGGLSEALQDEVPF